MKRTKRYPQYVLMLDLLMLLLFVLISNPIEEQIGISYAIVDEQLPPDTYIFVVDRPNNPTRHFNFDTQQWEESQGHFQRGDTLFVSCPTQTECLRFLPDSISVPKGQLLKGFSGRMLADIQRFVFNACNNPKFKKRCDKLKLFINKYGEISLTPPKS